MEQKLIQAFIQGAERVAAWADLLDAINVFPVADGDTGRNLKISLAPLRDLAAGHDATIHRILINARGNSGNIAARFFSGLLTAQAPELVPAAARLGRDRAWEAVHDPLPGTMLTLFDALADALDGTDFTGTADQASGIIEALEQSVRSTPDLLPKLRDAGVVDSGALAMYIYCEGFFHSLAEQPHPAKPVTAIFRDLLRVRPSFNIGIENGYCVDIALNAPAHHEDTARVLAGLGESVVIIPGDDCLKVHLHTDNTAAVREKVESLGTIVRWSDDNLGEQLREFRRPGDDTAIHIMTDAAGSVTREDARRLSMTLLDSYIIIEETSAPETCVDPESVYASMRRGLKASTSQASIFERHELYRRVTAQYARVLYLCVGSAFTGNYDAAMRWKAEHDPDGALTVIDTGAASGRLGMIALSTANRSRGTGDPDEVEGFARAAVGACREYIFIDNLKYLAAGGRISRTKAFFGNMLSMRPVVSPTAEGVVRAGVAKTLEEQIDFAMEKLRQEAPSGTRPVIMLQHTDNRALVDGRIYPVIKQLYPDSEILLQPLSLTTGVHTGPGTWSLAFLPES